MSHLPIGQAKPKEWRDAAPDPLDHPEFYDGVVLRRIAGHLIDLFFIIVLIGAFGVTFVFLGIISFGILWIPLLVICPVVTISYDALQVGGRHSATVGMRAMGLEVRSWMGTRPTEVQAWLRAIIFWGMSYLTGTVLMWLLLGFALFNTRRRCLHDFLSGTVVIRSARAMVLSP